MSPDPVQSSDRGLRSINRIDLIGAVLSIAVGLGTISEGLRYSIGSLQRMGPGFFPVSLGVVLAFLGLVLLVAALRTHDVPPDRVEFRAVVAVLSGVLCFALLLRTAGLVPAVMTMVIVSSLASSHQTIARILALALFVAGLNVILFIYLLELPLKTVNLPDWVGF